MKKDIFLWSLGGFTFTSLFGTFLHFLYDLSGKRLWAAVISGVNESTWEHMKLLFFPMFFFALFQYGFFKEREDFWCIQLKSILLGQILIPIFFYTYNGAVGKSPDWLNIAIFFLSAFFAYGYQLKRLRRESLPCSLSRLALAPLFLLAVLFAVFTFFPPQIGLFRDPLTGAFGR